MISVQVAYVYDLTQELCKEQSLICVEMVAEDDYRPIAMNIALSEVLFETSFLFH